MRALILSSILFLAACSATLPSFYDDNESLLAVEVRAEVAKLDCTKPDPTQIKHSVDKLNLYSESKRSKDVGQLISMMKQTSDGLYKKSDISQSFCNIKKTLLEKQSADIANAIMRRY